MRGVLVEVETAAVGAVVRPVPVGQVVLDHHARRVVGPDPIRALAECSSLAAVVISCRPGDGGAAGAADDDPAAGVVRGLSRVTQVAVRRHVRHADVCVRVAGAGRVEGRPEAGQPVGQVVVQSGGADLDVAEARCALAAADGNAVLKTADVDVADRHVIELDVAGQVVVQVDAGTLGRCGLTDDGQVSDLDPGGVVADDARSGGRGDRGR